MSEYVYAGLTSQSIDLFIRDSASTTGQGLTGLVYNASNLVASYRKGQTGSRTAITLATQTVTGSFSSGGFVEIDATNMPGCYRLDLPNAAVDTAGFVTVFLKGAANMVPVALRIDCRPIPADMKQIGGNTQSATDLKDFADTGYDPATHKLTEAVGLDSASVTAVQSGLALEATSQSIKSKTDNLPSDPADQSLVIAATDAVMSRLGVPAGASMSADIAAVKTDTGNLVTRITANLFSGITYLSRWLGALAGKTADTTTRTEINATTAGAGYNETTDSQEAIRDRGDSAWITGSGGGGGTTTIVTLQAASGISPGVIVGPSEPLVIGDDYLTVMNRSVRINLLDQNGDPAEVEYGTYALDDDGISIQMLLAKSGKPSVEALIVGTCTFFPAVGDVPPYLIVEFTKVETAKAIPGPYDMQVEAVWNDGKVVTFAPYGQIEFTRDIGRRT